MMGDDPLETSKRRHILSSINPEGPQRKTSKTKPEDEEQRHHDLVTKSSSGSPCRCAGDQDEQDDGEAETTKPRRSRLKLKDHKSRRRRRSRSRSPRDKHRDRRGDDSPERSSHRHRHRHRHSHRRHRRSPTPPNPHEPPPLDPEAAFRESLFDAMADDEGASYWEGVYGQPVHVYSNERVGPTGELEQMTEDEYAAYVRQKMWEKTHAGLIEERARREEARKRKEAEDRHARKLHEEMEHSLRRGEERRQRRHWAARFEEYAQAWATRDGSNPTASEQIAWPVESGRAEDVEPAAVRSFLVHGLALDDLGEQAFVARLKEERIRWHPDKMQQRLGGSVDEPTMRLVTSIFQTIDRLWSDVRPKQGV